MAPPLIILPVETKAREFHGKLLLTFQLLARGHPVLLGEQWRLWELCDLFTPGIFVDKSVAATHRQWIQRCRAMGHLVVSWDEEGLVFFDAWMYRRLRIDPRSFAGIERFFAWGEAQQQAICEEYPHFREKIVLCGNPRFDLLRPEWRGFYQPAVDRLQQRFGPMILINTNFAFYNHYKSEDELRRTLQQYPLAQEPGYMEGWIAMHRHAHESFRAMVPELARRYPRHTVVVRPHPSERHEPWLELARQHPKIHVDASGNVHEWILAADAVIHFNCTTAVEAFLLDVPAIAYRPAQYPRYENPLPNELSVNVFSLDELWTALEQRASFRQQGRLWTDGQKAVAARHVAALTGPTAAERIAGEISALAGRMVRKPRKNLWRPLAPTRRAWRRILQTWRAWRRPTDGYLTQKLPGIAAEEIQEGLGRLQPLSGTTLAWQIRPVTTNCHLIVPLPGRGES